MPYLVHSNEQLPPESWACLAEDLPWDSARIKDEIASQLLETLHGFPSQRELVVRPGSNMGASRFNSEINSSRRKVEAVIIFMTGHVSGTPCTGCQEKRGPFSFCVQSSAPENLGACANCWWLTSQERQCSLHCLHDTPVDYDSMFESPNAMTTTPGFRRAIRERLEPLFTATAKCSEAATNNGIFSNQELFVALEDMIHEFQELKDSFQAPEDQGDQ